MNVVLFFLLLSLLSSAQEKKSPIRFSVVESWAEPYAVFDSRKILVGGINHDFMIALSKKLSSSYEFVYLSRGRVEGAADRGLLDIRCILHESWVLKKENYHWSQPIFSLVNGIVWKKGTPPIEKLSGLENRTIGTVTGYMYKSIDPMVAEGKLKRADVENESINVGLLSKGRISYAFTEISVFRSQVKSKKIEDLKSAGFLPVEEIPVKCGLVKTSSIKQDDFDTAINSLQKDGTLKQLQLKYDLK